jgi:hypothetical protein
METTMKLNSGILLPILALSLLGWSGIGATIGDDKSTGEPTGTWRVVNRSNNSTQLRFEYILRLNMNAGTLTGTLSQVGTVNESRLYQWEVKEVKIKGEEISFTVTHPFDVGRGIITWSYKGNITGDSMKGKITKEAAGETHTGNWSAERVKN